MNLTMCTQVVLETKAQERMGGEQMEVINTD